MCNCIHLASTKSPHTPIHHKPARSLKAPSFYVSVHVYIVLGSELAPIPTNLVANLANTDSPAATPVPDVPTPFAPVAPEDVTLAPGGDAMARSIDDVEVNEVLHFAQLWSSQLSLECEVHLCWLCSTERYIAVRLTEVDFGAEGLCFIAFYSHIAVVQ